MIPRLFESTETAFTSFGICPLSEAISCTVTEERNGPYTLTMEYPTDGMWFDEIKVDRIILAQAHENDTQTQPFRIESISGDMDGVVTIEAVHISYMLNWIICAGATIYSDDTPQYNMRTVKDDILSSSCPFSFYSDITTTAEVTVSEAVPFRSLLGGIKGSFLDLYGGEFMWDRFNVYLLDGRGDDNGVRITYGKNLTGLDWETDVSETYTSVVAYYKTEDSGAEVYVEGTVQSVGTNNFAFQRTLVVDATDQFDSTPTAAQLNTYAAAYVKANALAPVVSVKVSFVPLWHTEEYKDFAAFEKVNLCDIVHIVYPPLGLTLSAEVVKTTYNVLLDRYDEIEIDTVKKTLADTIFEMQKEIKNK